MPERATSGPAACPKRSEESAKAIVAGDREGPNGRECAPVLHEGAVPQKSTPARMELAPEDRVKPERTAQRGNSDDAARTTSTGGSLWHAVNFPNRRMRTRMSGGVGGG